MQYKLEDFSVLVTNEKISEKNYSFSAGQYFEVKIDYIDITPEEFTIKMESYAANLESYLAEGKRLETEIWKQLRGLKFES